MSRAHRPGRVFYSPPAAVGDFPVLAGLVQGSFSIDPFEFLRLRGSRVVFINLGSAPIQHLLGSRDDFRDPPLRIQGDDESAVPADTVAVLVALAKEDHEQDFRDLAAMSGVAPDRLNALWIGTRRRVSHG